MEGVFVGMVGLAVCIWVLWKNWKQHVRETQGKRGGETTKDIKYYPRGSSLISACCHASSKIKTSAVSQMSSPFGLHISQWDSPGFSSAAWNLWTLTTAADHYIKTTLKDERLNDFQTDMHTFILLLNASINQPIISSIKISKVWILYCNWRAILWIRWMTSTK